MGSTQIRTRMKTYRNGQRNSILKVTSLALNLQMIAIVDQRTVLCVIDAWKI